MKRLVFVLGVMCLLVVAGGCKKEEDRLAKIRDLEFTVLAEENIPEELLQMMEEKKPDGFKMTYQDSGFLYLCAGYGEQESGGFSITVDELYETENAIYLNTTLMGPKPEEREKLSEKKESRSYPYVVVKIENSQKPIVFQ